MKLIQTFWLRPADTKDNNAWANKKSEILSLALSSLLLKKYNSSTHLGLVTDSFTYSILKQVFTLPYDSVDLSLDSFRSEFEDSIWMLPKLYSYSIQYEPFINIDTDVFKWSSLNVNLNQDSIIVQNLEIGFDFYNEIHIEFIKHFGEFVPINSDKALSSSKSFCVGIIGGENPIFREFYSDTLTFLDKNKTRVNNFKFKNSLSIYIEQFLFYHYAIAKGKVIRPILPEVSDPNYPGFAAFNFLPSVIDFIHPLGKTKKITWVGEQIENRIRLEFPELYYELIFNLKQLIPNEIYWRPSYAGDYDENHLQISKKNINNAFKRTMHLYKLEYNMSINGTGDELTVLSIKKKLNRSSEVVKDCFSFEESSYNFAHNQFNSDRTSWLRYSRLISEFNEMLKEEYWDDNYRVMLDTECISFITSKWRWSLNRDYNISNERIEVIEDNVSKIPMTFYTAFYFDFAVNRFVENELTTLEAFIFQIIAKKFCSLDEIFENLKDFFSLEIATQNGVVIFKARIIERLRSWGFLGKILIK
jgi:hypothetical protein